MSELAGARVEPGRGTHVVGGKNPVRVGAGKGTHVYLDRFHEVLKIAGIKRRVRWHDASRHLNESPVAERLAHAARPPIR